MQEYYIGQIFNDPYPEDAADWCNNNDAYIDEIEPKNGIRRFQIKEQYQPTDKDRQNNFESTFIQTSWGWYRKQPKGYANAPQSVDIIDRLVTKFNGFTETIDDMMLFYEKPDFSKPSQCTENWLVAHQYHHGACTKEEFDAFYLDFQTCWAREQYK